MRPPKYPKKPTLWQSFGGVGGAIVTALGIAAIPSQLGGWGIPIAALGVLWLGGSVLFYIRQLRAHIDRLEAGPPKARRIAANHYDYFRELHGDFHRHYVPGITQDERQFWRDHVVGRVKSAHDNLVAVDRNAADYFIDGKDIDALELDFTKTARVIQQKMDRLKDIKDNWSSG